MKATRSEVMSVEAPAFTSTWHPFSHGDIIRSMLDATCFNELEVLNERYELTSNGDNLFATWTVQEPNFTNDPSELTIQLGFRNSLNKTFAFGIVAGTRVLVCSNLCFSGEYLTFRKHTGGLDLAELNYFSAISVAKSQSKMDSLANWQTSLREIDLPTSHAKILTYDAMNLGAISPSKFSTFTQALEMEQQLSGNTLYAWHGAGTRVCRENSLNAIAAKTSKLNQVADDYRLRLAA